MQRYTESLAAAPTLPGPAHPQRATFDVKIGAIRTAALDLPVDGGLSKRMLAALPCLLVSVETTDGATGRAVLYCMNPRLLPVLASAVDAIGASWRDRSVDDIEGASRDTLGVLRPFGPEGIVTMAVSVIERACWDARATSIGVPVGDLIGRMKTEVPVYASGLWLYHGIDELVAEANRFVGAGFRAIKMRVGKPDYHEDVERVRAVREAVGPNIALMVDANERYSPDTAIALGELLERCHLAWIEEPVDSLDVAGTARVSEALETPIAVGEHVFLARNFGEIVRRRAADILMPDLGRVGGFCELLRVGELAAANGLLVTPHSYPYESIHAVAAMPSATYVEYLPWFDRLYRDRLLLADGRARVPTGPGIGYAIDEDAVADARRGPAPEA